MMFSSNIEIVRESIGPHHRQTVTMTLIHFAHGVGRLRGKLILRCIGTVFGSAVADTVDRFKSQVFDGFNLHIYVGIERTILAVVIAIHHHVSIRITIVYIPVGVYRRIVVAISIINGIIGDAEKALRRLLFQMFPVPMPRVSFQTKPTCSPTVTSPFHILCSELTRKLYLYNKKHLSHQSGHPDQCSHLK